MKPRITFIVISYQEEWDAYMFLGAMKCQKNPDFQCIIYHDGPNEKLRTIVESFGDPRFIYKEATENLGAWGAYNRIDALENMVDSEYVVQCTIQEYYLPNAVNEILNAGGDFIYWPVVHHAFQYQILNPSLRIGAMDWSNFAIKTSIAKLVGIRKPDSYVGDGIFVEDCAASGLLKKINRIDKVLSIKN